MTYLLGSPVSEAQSSSDWKNHRRSQETCATGQTSSSSRLSRKACGAGGGLVFACLVFKTWLVRFIFGFIFCLSLGFQLRRDHRERCLLFGSSNLRRGPNPVPVARAEAAWPRQQAPWACLCVQIWFYLFVWDGLVGTACHLGPGVGSDGKQAAFAPNS